MSNSRMDFDKEWIYELESKTKKKVEKKKKERLENVEKGKERIWENLEWKKI